MGASLDIVGHPPTACRRPKNLRRRRAKPAGCGAINIEKWPINASNWVQLCVWRGLNKVLLENYSINFDRSRLKISGMVDIVGVEHKKNGGHSTSFRVTGDPRFNSANFFFGKFTINLN